MPSSPPRRLAGGVALALAALLSFGCQAGLAQSSPPAAAGSIEPRSRSTSTATAAPTTAPTPQPTAAAPALPGAAAPAAGAATPVYSYRVVRSYPHDPDAFTQGLVYLDGELYEGTGLEGRSSLRRVALETGEVLQRHNLSAEYFGEGVAIIGDRIYQLTWKSGVGFIYDRRSFALVGTFNYTTEGWGLAYDGTRLVMSDGSDTLFFRDPATLEVTGSVRVFDEAGPVVRLNELEYVNGEIWANIWLTDRVARIDPATGRVKAYIDFSGLLNPADLTRAVDVLNGIAHDPATGRVFITGKLWPKLFEVELIPPTTSDNRLHLPLVQRG